jgi:hypothetical protein
LRPQPAILVRRPDEVDLARVNRADFKISKQISQNPAECALAPSGRAASSVSSAAGRRR